LSPFSVAIHSPTLSEIAPKCRTGRGERGLRQAFANLQAQRIGCRVRFLTEAINGTGILFGFLRYSFVTPCSDCNYLNNKSP
jgi:hypothetical protein